MEISEPRTMNHSRNSLHFDWLWQMLIRPGKTLARILEVPKANWQTPLLCLAVAGIVEVIVAGPIKKAAIELGSNLPPGFEYYSPDQQQQFMQAQASQTSALFLYVFPIIGALLGIWISWFLLRSFLHLSLTLAGSRGKNILSGNLTAWASVPLIFRSIVHIVYMLASGSAITARGLSGMVTAANGGGQFASALLALVDIYLVWQVVLILIGSEKISGLPRLKAWGASLAAVVVLLLLQALPAFIGAQLSGLSMTRMFF